MTNKYTNKYTNNDRTSFFYVIKIILKCFLHYFKLQNMSILFIVNRILFDFKTKFMLYYKQY